MHDGMPYGRNQGQGQRHSREVDRQSPTGLIFCLYATAQETETLCPDDDNLDLMKTELT